MVIDFANITFLQAKRMPFGLMRVAKVLINFDFS